MSDYVEARYALLIIEQAHNSGDAVARDLIEDLLRDLCPHAVPNEPKESKRVKALQALRTLALGIRHFECLPAAYWQEALRTAGEWCNEAAAA